VSPVAGPGGLALVVFDWAGTTVDHGCFAPIRPFVETLASAGVALSAEEARGPMGLHKRDHLRSLLTQPEVAARWRGKHGRDADEEDVARLYEQEFVPRQLEALRGAGRPIEGVVSCVEELRSRGLRIGSTTGYFRDALEVVAREASGLGYAPDHAFCPSDVPEARPAPWMIFRNMEASGVFPPARVVKVGDTVPDVQEGRNAGVWSVGVARTGSLVGLDAGALAALPAPERTRRVEAAGRTLAEAGAHAVIESVAGLPAVMDELAARLARGERP